MLEHVWQPNHKLYKSPQTINRMVKRIKGAANYPPNHQTAIEQSNKVTKMGVELSNAPATQPLKQIIVIIP